MRYRGAIAQVGAEKAFAIDQPHQVPPEMPARPRASTTRQDNNEPTGQSHSGEALTVTLEWAPDRPFSRFDQSARQFLADLVRAVVDGPCKLFNRCAMERAAVG